MGLGAGRGTGSGGGTGGDGLRTNSIVSADKGFGVAWLVLEVRI